jgi:hypothetical protein
MNTMKRTLHISPVASLTPLIGDGELVAFNVGPDGVVYIVVALNPLDYRTTDASGASFAKTVPMRPQRYRVVGLSGTVPVLDVVIEEERFNIHDVQPLVDELLLVCARCRKRGRDDYDRNGRVYTRGGEFSREILLGDGNQSTQATSKGTIWTSFFDEGVGGNFGWRRNPVGAAGLVAWDPAGNKMYEFQPGSGLDSICDCYALNVQSEENVWLYYYTEFPLVHLHRRKIKSVWKMPVDGSDGFAVSARHALFRGGYGEHDTYRLFSLGPGGAVESVAKLELKDPKRGKIAADCMVGRGDTIHLLSDGFLYRVEVQAAVAAVGG